MRRVRLRGDRSKRRERTVGEEYSVLVGREIHHDHRVLYIRRETIVAAAVAAAAWDASTRL